MCDYSLEDVPRRAQTARVGERLVLTHFVGTRSLGLSNKVGGEAVCLLLGTKVMISGIPHDLRTKQGLGEDPVEAMFVRLNRVGYRDAFSFGEGHEPVLIQDFADVVDELCIDILTTPEDPNHSLPILQSVETTQRVGEHILVGAN